MYNWEQLLCSNDIPLKNFENTKYIILNEYICYLNIIIKFNLIFDLGNKNEQIMF